MIEREGGREREARGGGGFKNSGVLAPLKGFPPVSPPVSSPGEFLLSVTFSLLSSLFVNE